MSGDEGRRPLSKEQNYESVVLDFLDREMVAVQPADKKNEHSDDLDALVSDLLKQVISEADQADAPPAAYDETEALLAEFPPVEVGPLEPKAPAGTKATDHSLPAAPAAPETGRASLEVVPEMELASLEAESEMELAALEAESEVELAAIEAESEIELAALEAEAEMNLPALEAAVRKVLPGMETGIGTMRPPANVDSAFMKAEPPEIKTAAAPAPFAGSEKAVPALFATTEKPKGKNPAMAIVAVCLLAAIGFGAYYFLSGSREAPPALSSAPTEMEPAAPEVATMEPARAQTEPVVRTQPASARTAVAAPPPATITAEAAAPVTAAQVPAPPRNERPGLIRGTDQIAAASRQSAVDSLIPSTAPGRAAPAAPKPPRPAPAKAAPLVSGTLIPATPIAQVSPRYPEIAVRTRTSAVVELDIVIDASGRVIDASPVSGPAMFHKEAVDAAMKWRYRPASIGGSNVQSQTRITMKFNLR